MKIRRSGGFTLIETILTLLIVGIGLFGIMVLYNNLSFQMYHADFQVIASDLAQQKAEQLVAQKAFSGYAALLPGQTVEAVVNGNATFTRTTTIDYIIFNNDNTITVSVIDTGYKRIQVNTTWPGGSTGMTVTTLVTNQVPL